MTVVFCTTCKGRVKHLALTLRKNMADCPSAKFVVLDYGDRDGLRDHLLGWFGRDMAEERLVIYHHPSSGPFHMTHAKNMVHRLGIVEGGKVLVNVDSDNYINAGFDSYVDRELTPESFLWSRMVPGKFVRGISGRIAVSAQDFVKAGGYDERYAKWSPDDKDFNSRLRRLGLEAKEIDEQYLHGINHNDKVRFKEYPEAKALHGEEQFEVSETATVVNNGRIGCGRVFRNYCGDPIEISPIPTRIFGIGLHKTATTSLHKAFQILSLESTHWPSAHWAKRVWQEMQEGRSLTLDKCYAACDLPISLLFKKLDVAYPGSKFVLTVRGEENWLRSVEKHWGSGNEFRHQWDNDPFTHRMHKLLYGRVDFHGPTFLDRYRRHNAEVREHFRERPGDLLVMDMDGGAGWPELCAFLGKRLPEVEYPHEFKSNA